MKEARNGLIEKVLAAKGLDGEELSDEEGEQVGEITGQCKNIWDKLLSSTMKKVLLKQESVWMVVRLMKSETFGLRLEWLHEHTVQQFLQEVKHRVL